MVTLDTWITGWRPRDLGASNFPQLRGNCLANYTTDPVFRARLGQDPARDPAATVSLWAQLFGNPLTWDELVAKFSSLAAGADTGRIISGISNHESPASLLHL